MKSKSEKLAEIKARYGRGILTSIIPLILLIPLLPFAHAVDPSCWELGECLFAEDPLTVMLMPFDSVFAGFSLVVFWGLLVGILWIRTHNTMMVSLIGITMVATYMASAESVSPEFEQARIIGAVLILVSMGFAVYQMFIHKPHTPPGN